MEEMEFPEGFEWLEKLLREKEEEAVKSLSFLMTAFAFAFAELEKPDRSSDPNKSIRDRVGFWVDDLMRQADPTLTLDERTQIRRLYAHFLRSIDRAGETL